jgi:hypothetical protein
MKSILTLLCALCAMTALAEPPTSPLEESIHRSVALSLSPYIDMEGFRVLDSLGVEHDVMSIANHAALVAVDECLLAKKEVGQISPIDYWLPLMIGFGVGIAFMLLIYKRL